MADEDSDLERTEPASPRRLEEARNKGNIPRSRELATFAILITAAVALLIMGARFAEGLKALMQHWFTFSRATLQDPMLMWNGFVESALAMLILMSPLFLVLLIAAFVAPISMGGWMISGEAMAPKFSRLNPIKGIARIFSWNGIVEMLKAVLKSVVLGGLAFWVIWGRKDEILSLSKEGLAGGIPHFFDILGWSFVWFCTTLLLIAAVDVPFQLWDYHRKLRMTKEEVRKEMKESEGDPYIKGRIRALQREAARKRMMAEVPKADVIVTNPTHYAAALVYKAETMSAPKVVAKGSYLLAQRIREIGEEHGIPILQAPPLARALYKHAELDQEIPSGLFAAVAEVLAYIYQLRSYNDGIGVAPEQPKDLPVPKELDFEPEELSINTP